MRYLPYLKAGIRNFKAKWAGEIRIEKNDHRDYGVHGTKLGRDDSIE